MKKFSLGFITAILITCTLSVQAEIKEYILHLVDYKVMVDGEEYNDPEYPTLNHEGTTYVPMKKLGDILGVDVKWNNELYQAEITRVEEEDMSYLYDFVDITLNETYKGEYNAITYNGYYYIDFDQFVDKYDLEYEIEWGESFTQYYLVKYNDFDGEHDMKIYTSARSHCIRLTENNKAIDYVNLQLLLPIIGD